MERNIESEICRFLGLRNEEGEGWGRGQKYHLKRNGENLDMNRVSMEIVQKLMELTKIVAAGGLNRNSVYMNKMGTVKVFRIAIGEGKRKILIL